MLTPYERSQLELAVDCIQAGSIPPNLEKLAGILEHCLREDQQAEERKTAYAGAASRDLIRAMDVYGLPVRKGDTVGEVLTAIVAAESRYQKSFKEIRYGRKYHSGG